jgi:hypothetical protein
MSEAKRPCEESAMHDALRMADALRAAVAALSSLEMMGEARALLDDRPAAVAALREAAAMLRTGGRRFTPKDMVFGLVGHAFFAKDQSECRELLSFAMFIWRVAHLPKHRGRPGGRPLLLTDAQYASIDELVSKGLTPRAAVRKLAADGRLKLHSPRTVDTVVRRYRSG